MKRSLLLVTALVAVPALASCSTESTKPSAVGNRSLTVEASDDACKLSADSAPAGTLTFDIANLGAKTTEFYLLAEDGLAIVAEVENIGQGGNGRLTVAAPAGNYITACKPGMVGEGIRANFTVTKSDEEPKVSEDEAELIATAQKNYAAYVEDQSAQLLTKTQEFVTAYGSGDDELAREIYPNARTHWERIETVAESFGLLDPKMDAREADVDFAGGEKWTGWHFIEKDLWPARAEKSYQALNPKQRKRYAANLLKNTQKLDKLIQNKTYPVDSIARGSTGLLEEVATGKVTGEEEYWSRTDLWDFQANVDGAKVAFEGVRPLVEKKDADLAKTLDERFAELQVLLDAQRVDDGFKLYDDLTPAEVKALADAVNALSEPLSKLAEVVLS